MLVGARTYIASGSGFRFIDVLEQRYIGHLTYYWWYRDAATDLGASGGRFKDLYLSGGVYLGGTGAANKLDDYEEGGSLDSFIDFDGGNSRIQLNILSGRYTKSRSKCYRLVIYNCVNWQ